MSVFSETFSPSYFVLIDTEKDSLKLTTINSITSQAVPSLTFVIDSKFKSVKEFIKNFITIFPVNSVKAVVLQVFGFKTAEFLCNAEFCNCFTVAFTAAKLPFYFISPYNWVITCLFIFTNTTVSLNERVVCIFTHEKYFDVASYKFTKNGYIKIYDRRFTMDNGMMEFSQRDFEALNRPAKIVVTTSDFYPLPVRALERMKLDGFIFVHPLCLLERNRPAVEICKWILDPINNLRYHLIPTCTRKYVIATTINGTHCNLLIANLYAPLPFKKAVHTSKSVFDDCFYYKDANSNDMVILGRINLPKNCHRNKVSLTIDINNFPTFDVTNLVFQQMLDLPSNLNEKSKSKIPVIAFCDNFSTICHHKNDEIGYEFVDAWNGVYGEVIIISFYDHDEPKVRQKAAEDYRIKPACVVYELLQIMAMTPTTIKQEYFWQFNVSTNAKNEIIVKVGDKDGKVKNYKPSTLMAMILKEHLKIINDETGAEANELGFWFLDDFNDEEKLQIKSGINDACKLLKIKCTFI